MNVAAILPRFAHVGNRQARAAKAPLAPVAGSPADSQRTLHRNDVFTLQNAPLRLYVLRGTVWVTRDGCAKDIVLGAGDVFEQQPGAPVLVQALEASELRIAKAAARAQNA